MPETEAAEEKVTGRLEDLASDPRYLEEYLAIRVDIGEEEETGTIIGHGRDLEDLQELVKKDRESINPGNEYHIFYPPMSGETARKVVSSFAPGNQFRRVNK